MGLKLSPMTTIEIIKEFFYNLYDDYFVPRANWLPASMELNFFGNFSLKSYN